ncbi:MAG: helix-turn-helix transcriptional regulator, partial [Thermodesulfobacteriota bacterium]
MIDEERNTNYEDFLEGIDRMKDQAKGETDFLEGITALSGEPARAEVLGPLGDRVRTIRDQKGLTLADVASRTGFDEGYLARIEDNDVSPPLGVLIKLSKALDMKMGYFISGGETKPFTVVRENERQLISRRASSDDRAYGYTYESLAPGKTD